MGGFLLGALWSGCVIIIVKRGFFVRDFQVIITWVMESWRENTGMRRKMYVSE